MRFIIKRLAHVQIISVIHVIKKYTGILGLCWIPSNKPVVMTLSRNLKIKKLLLKTKV